MKKYLISILISSLLTTTTLAQCPKVVTPLEKGEISPCAGFLFSPEKELQLRLRNEEYKTLEEMTKIYLQQKNLLIEELKTAESIIEKEKNKADLWRKSAEETTTKFITSERQQTIRDWTFLLGGVILTMASAWSLQQVSN